MKSLIAVFALSAALFSCGRIKDKTKETINESGEVIGKAGSEFVEGVTEGVERTFDCEIALSQELKDHGLKTGKFTITSSAAGGTNNVLTLYVIFDKAFKKDVSAKVFDKTGSETGRSKLLLEGAAGDATYYDFTFDKRTVIEVRSKIIIE